MVYVTSVVHQSKKIDVHLSWVPAYCSLGSMVNNARTLLSQANPAWRQRAPAFLNMESKAGSEDLAEDVKVNLPMLY